MSNHLATRLLECSPRASMTKVAIANESTTIQSLCEFGPSAPSDASTLDPICKATASQMRLTACRSVVGLESLGPMALRSNGRAERRGCGGFRSALYSPRVRSSDEVLGINGSPEGPRCISRTAPDWPASRHSPGLHCSADTDTACSCERLLQALRKSGRQSSRNRRGAASQAALIQTSPQGTRTQSQKGARPLVQP